MSVVLFHATHWPTAGGVITDTFMYGFMGVPLFFAISGFVILMTSQNRNALAFVNSRITRLFPTFWICVGLSCLALELLGPGAPSLAVIAANLTMQSQLLFDQPYIDSVYWTLAVEVKFYALMFLVILTGQMKRIELLLVLWLAVVIVEAFAGAPAWLESVTMPKYASLFIAGCYAFLIRSRGPTFGRLAVFAVCTGASIYWLLQYQYVYTKTTALAVQLTIAALVLAISALLLLVALRKWTLPTSRAWFWVGLLTYPLYLTHARPGNLVWASLPGNEWTRVWVTLALVLVVSAVIAFVIERHTCGALNRRLNQLTQPWWSKLMEQPAFAFARRSRNGPEYAP